VKLTLSIAMPALRVLGSAVLFFGALGVHPHALLMWFAPLPLLLSDNLRWKRAFLEGLLASALGGMAWWSYLSRMAPLPIALLAILQAALIFGVAMGLVVAARRLGRLVLAALMLPLTVTSVDLLVSKLSPHGSFGSIAYSQSDNLALMQLVSVTGLAGVSFLLCWVPAGLAAVWWSRRTLKRAAWFAVAACLPLVLALAGGTIRLQSASTAPSMRVALIAEDARLRFFDQSGTAIQEQILASDEQQIAAAAAQGARLVVLPEKTVSLSAQQLPQVQQRWQQISDRTNASVLVGVNVLGPLKHNLAWLFTPMGRAPLSYEKQHLVPGWEVGYAHGEQALLTRLAGQPVGIAICKDLDFPSTLAAYGDRSLMLVPAWDFGEDAWLHSRMAFARAIEQGFSMARSAHEGKLSLVDGSGRVLAERTTDKKRAVQLVGDLPLASLPTAYKRVGDLFGWTIVVAWLLALAHLLTQSSKRPSPPA
jgi:apolipoprotein N-acyltransferase